MIRPRWYVGLLRIGSPRGEMGARDFGSERGDGGKGRLFPRLFATLDVLTDRDLRRDLRTADAEPDSEARDFAASLDSPPASWGDL